MAFGDSVTQGCMEYATIEHEQVYHNLLKNRIVKRYPTTILNVINAGVSGDTAVKSEARWQRDVIAYQPDLVTIGFGVNDCHTGEAGLKPYMEKIDAFVRTVKRDTEADLLLLTPNMMMLHDNDNIHEKDRTVLPRFTDTAEKGYLRLYTLALREYLEQEKLVYVDIYALFENWLLEGQAPHARLANGINHPDRALHVQIAEQIEARIFEEHDKLQ
ncbi:SGNH/GDSL hydrolase family protein [Paenibacillus allorhizoplanae]|uniref:SGNH/GDSL hydrolase family protein n=1 Tax=Paenibacillus allorhizoplanae TaxID=2905648 RepID=UPI001F227745|nr:GDSL-type esterase/lipase family protein [Paenibacillus allorhizoplanae]